MAEYDPIQLLQDCYSKALEAADPLLVIPKHLPPPPMGKTVVVGIGKAAAAMAQALETHWNGGPLSGVIVVPRGATKELKYLDQIEGSHPIPDESSVLAGRKLMAAVTGLGPDDLVIALISGGGSALCALPAEGVSLHDKQAITRDLLLRGASILEINTVRKHLSALKGGRLAKQALPARVVTLLISDIPGDDPQLIASAPTLADPSTCGDALKVLQKYEVQIPPQLEAMLRSDLLESPKPPCSSAREYSYVIVARAQDGLEAAAKRARDAGLDAHILSDAMQGDVHSLAQTHVALARQIQRYQQPFKPPCVLLSGGEATVNVTGNGRGGRNTEFALAMAVELDAQQGIYALSAGTDGLDGNGAAAGAWIDPETLVRSEAMKLNAEDYLSNNDSYTFFDRIESAVVTGPTFTNINDFRAVLILPIDTNNVERNDES